MQPKIKALRLIKQQVTQVSFSFFFHLTKEQTHVFHLNLFFLLVLKFQFAYLASYSKGKSVKSCILL